MNWWTGRKDERFWCEITSRDDVGADLRCPQTRADGTPFWGYDLMHDIRPDDVVFHYKDGRFVGASRAVGKAFDRDIVWQPRGTSGRRNPLPDAARSGWALNLRDLVPVDFSLEEIRRDDAWVRAQIKTLGKPTKIPFLVQKGQLRATQGYLTKLPRSFVDRWPVLLAAVADLDGVKKGERGDSVDDSTADPELLSSRARRIRATGRDATQIRENSSPVQVERSVRSWVRSPSVVAHVLARARGRCEGCDEVPFVDDDGDAFLEVHHVWTLAEGGPDTVENAVALCPNCHRALHHAHDRRKRRDALFARVPSLRRWNQASRLDQ